MKNLFICVFTCIISIQLKYAHAIDQTKTSFISDSIKIETLGFDREWLLLNHFWKNILGVRISRIDDPDFFLSRQRSDPRLELEAFIKALTEETISNNESLQCRFPARFLWVDEKFSLTKNNIVVKVECEEFETWKESINLKRLVLVFPAAYLNNPASMFGHTLLRLDSEQGIENPLLSHAAGFSAATGNDGGVAFAVKGLFGGYRSSYSVEPYYETVKRYGDIEHRDIWEYELLLTPSENERVMASLWELGHTYFDYYFFDENCSYYLLALLETIRPELNLIDGYGYWVIPSDTLKTLLSRNEILGEVKFRPSLTSKLEAQSSRLSSDNLNLALEIAKGSESVAAIPSDREGLADLLEFSFDYLEYSNDKRDSKADLATDRNIAKEILMKRSLLPTSIRKQYPISKPETRPDLAHDSGRILTSVGRRGSQGFYDVELKPAYHDLLDRFDGFKGGAAIDFFNLRLRHYETKNVALQSFYPISIESYSQWNKLFRPLSWNIKTGLERELVSNEGKSDVLGDLIGVIRTDAGVTTKLFDLFSFSILPGVRANVSPSYSDSDYAIGAGIGFRLFGTATDNLRYLVGGDLSRFGIGEDHSNNNIRAELNYDVGRQFIFRTGVQRQQSFNNYYTEYYIGFGSYF